ncbi:MAG: ribonucleoside triphosphate reductase [Alphaproteobacteria bacterium]|nr:ribonucleoside triphosphate reductase [Alphaproteobacteria bacterium]
MASTTLAFRTDPSVSSPQDASKGTMIDCSDTVEEYVSKTDWRINANANVGYSHAGLVNNIAGKVIANFWLDDVYTPEEGRAHREGDYHIHDLDSLAGYCAGWSLRQLLTEGFNGVVGRVSSRPPRHFREALGQMANFLGILQSEWAGAQAFSSFDTYLAPLVFIDQLGDGEIVKAIRQFVYNLNVPARWGQSPFTNVTMDITCPADLKTVMPMCGTEHIFDGVRDGELLRMARQRRPEINKLTDMTYGDFAPEMERIVLAYYEVMTEGDMTGQPFTFPIPTVNITEDFKWDSRVADVIFANTAKVGSSYFQNFIGSQYTRDENGHRHENPEAYKPGAVRSMCCRLQLDLRELQKRGNGLFGSAEMTGSIGVVTINMARLGYLHAGNEPKLIEALDRLMDLAYGTLEKKRVFVNDGLKRGLYPYTQRYLHSLRNHFSTIGVNGMNEMVENFTRGKADMTSPEGIEMSLRILDHMRVRLREYQEKSGNLYNLEASPAEGATYRFAKEDHKRFSDIEQAGSYPNIYYTNSSQIPVGHTEDPFEALDLQNKLQCKYTGGTVLHMYMNEKLESTESCKRLVRTVLENYQLPYVTVTPLFSVCDEHGYLSGEQKTCPTCGAKTQVWTRVMGYFRPVEGFNIGKKGEHRERVPFKEPSKERCLEERKRYGTEEKCSCCG